MKSSIKRKMTPSLCLPTYFPPIPPPYPPLTSLYPCSSTLFLMWHLPSPLAPRPIPLLSIFLYPLLLFSPLPSHLLPLSPSFFYYFPFLLIFLLLFILFYLRSSSFLLIPITSPSFHLSSSVLLFPLLSSRILFVSVFNFFLSSLFELILLLLLFLLSILISFSISFSSSFSFACF